MGWSVPPPADPDLARARDLFDPGPSLRLLADYLESRGLDLEVAHPIRAVYWPGRSARVSYRARARAGEGGRRHLTLCVEVRDRPRDSIAVPDGSLDRHGFPDPVEARNGTLIWTLPYDPVLAALPEAVDRRVLRRVLGEDAPAVLAPTIVSYRAARRAVVRYRIVHPGRAARTMFGKVLRDAPFVRTFTAYRNVARSGLRTARPSSAEGIPGLVLFPQLEGGSLRDRLLAGDPLPAPRRIVDLLGALGSTRWRGEGRPRRHSRSARSTGRLLAHLLPHRRAETLAVASALAERVDAVAPWAPTHGDLYDAQVFVTRDRSLGLIDLEDAGPGDPLLDAGNMLAHLSALPASVSIVGRRSLAYRALLRRELVAQGVPTAELDWREAFCLFLLAPGPFTAASPQWPAQVETRLEGVIRLLGRAQGSSG